MRNLTEFDDEYDDPSESDIVESFIRDEVLEALATHAELDRLTDGIDALEFDETWLEINTPETDEELVWDPAPRHVQ